MMNRPKQHSFDDDDDDEHLDQSSISSSQQHEEHHGADIPIETLISYLVAAKRSLSSIHHVHRATTILSEARSSLESATILMARTKYLRQSIDTQLTSLRSIQFGLESTVQSVRVEFQTTLNSLTQADQKLVDNIQWLKETQVEEGFKTANPYYAATVAAQEEGVANKGCLHDFVDDKPVSELKESIQTTINHVESSGSNVSQVIHNLEDDLQAVLELLSDRTAASSSTKSDIQQPNVPRLLKSLESHARDMAQSLESLVKHFDLCVTAIKHTEGGGAAVAQNVNADDLPEGVGVEAFEAPAQLMTDEERNEMLTVLENDAGEVDDVVLELQERGAEMDSYLEQVAIWRHRHELEYGDVARAFQLLERIGPTLTSHLAESARFVSQWTDSKVRLDEGIASIEDLCEVYENFLSAYDGMIVEAARRRTVKKKMEKVVLDAQAQLDRMYDEDLNEREIFRSEQGDYLPSDIWHGLSSLPARYMVQRSDEEGLGSIPELPKDTVAAALRRLKVARGMVDNGR